MDDKSTGELAGLQYFIWFQQMERAANSEDVILRPTRRFLTTSPIPLGYLARPLVCESRWSWDSGGASG